MNLKTSLDALTMETAVLGGAVLGCGGGGKLEDGLYLGEFGYRSWGSDVSLRRQPYLTGQPWQPSCQFIRRATTPIKFTLPRHTAL